MHSVESSSVNQSMILAVARVTRCAAVDEAFPASMIDAEEWRGAGCDGETEDEEREFHEMDGFRYESPNFECGGCGCCAVP